jgi:hypothetical protein
MAITTLESVASARRRKNRQPVDVESLVPRELREKLGPMIGFLEDYYRWMNAQDKINTGFAPSAAISELSYATDLDEASEQFLDLLQKELAASIPKKLLADRVKLYKNLIQYFLTRGSQESVQTFFRIFFDEDAEIYYPRKSLFIPSSGKWDPTRRTAVNVYQPNPENTPKFQIDFEQTTGLSGKFVVGDTVTGLYSDASGTITDVDDGVLTVINVEGNFRIGEPIYSFGDYFSTGGSGFPPASTGDLPTGFPGGSGYIQTGVDPAEAICTNVYKDGEVTFVLQTLTSTGTFRPGERIYGSNSGRYATVIRYVSPNQILVKNASGNFLPEETLTGDNPSSVYAEVELIYRLGGYLDNGGFVDDTIKLQDSYFWQQYSYVIRTERSLEEWSGMYSRLAHPSGFIFFGEVLLIAQLVGTLVKSKMPLNQLPANFIESLFRQIQIVLDVSAQSVDIFIQNGSQIIFRPDSSILSILARTYESIKFADSTPMYVYADLQISEGVNYAIGSEIILTEP